MIYIVCIRCYIYIPTAEIWKNDPGNLLLALEKGLTIKATSLVCACFLSLVYRSSTLYGSQKFTRSTHSAVVELCTRYSLYHI